MLYITLYSSSFFLQNVLFIRRQNHLNGKEYHYEIIWNGMWKMNLLFYILDFSLISFSNKYTIKLWFLKKEKKEKKMKSKRVMHFHLWNVHFLFIIDLYSPTLYKWNDQLEKWTHWNENDIWKQMKENGNEPDIIFMCISILYFFMFISLFQSWTSSYFRDRSFGRNGWCSQIPLPIILSLSKRKHIVIPVVIRHCVFINQIKRMKWMIENVMKSFDTQNDNSSSSFIIHS